MKLEILIDACEFWPRLRQEIADARECVYIQTLSFEGDSVGKQLAAAMLAAPAGDRRIIVDYYTRHILSDKFRYFPHNLLDSAVRAENRETGRMMAELRAGGVGVKFVSPFGPLMVNIPARNHKKIIIVDDEIAYIGGINFSDHNFAWHDLMLRIEDREVVAYLKNDFQTTWAGERFCGRRRFGDLELFSFDGRTNIDMFAPILQMMAEARESIYVQSPYLCFPFSDYLRAAAGRGVTVTVVTPEHNNKSSLGKFIRWEAARSGFDLWLYRGRMTHLKAMLIDDERLVLGSSNFDYYSYRFEQEMVGVITCPQTIARFVDRVVRPDRDGSVRDRRHAGGLAGYARNWEIRAIGMLSGFFN